jgi:hypothetical protein
MTRDFIDGERKRTVANLVVECLEKECVRHVFGFPGEEREDLLFALADSAVSFVPCRHEQGAAFIADLSYQYPVISGTKREKDRPGFAMLKAAHQRRFGILVFWASDRQTREGIRVTLNYLQRLEWKGMVTFPTKSNGSTRQDRSKT